MGDCYSNNRVAVIGSGLVVDIGAAVIRNSHVKVLLTGRKTHWLDLIITYPINPSWLDLPLSPLTYLHRWELPGNYPIFTAVMVIYHYVEIIWRIIVTPNLFYKIYNH